MSLDNTRKLYEISGYEVTDDGYAITLDRKRISTQGGMPFVVPFEGLASAVAAEWNAQDSNIRPETMPFTGFCCTSLETALIGRKSIINLLVPYAESDLLCYRAEVSKELQNHQEVNWQPLLDWAAVTYDARLTVTTGISYVEQPQEAIANLRHAVESLDDFQLTVLETITKITGSLVIGLCVISSRISADVAFETSQLDEIWQNRKWGGDAEEIRRTKSLHNEILNAVRFLNLVRGV